MDVARELRTSSGFLCLISWAFLVWGYHRPPTSDYYYDLDAGGGFAATFAVWLPGAALTLVLLVWAFWALRGRGHAAVFLVAAAGVVAFGFHVRRFDWLLGYLPSLEPWSWTATGVGLIAVTLAFAAWMVDLSRAGRAEPDAHVRQASVPTSLE